METANVPIHSPGLNADMMDRRSHKGRQRGLSLLVLLVGLYGLSRWTWYARDAACVARCWPVLRGIPAGVEAVLMGP